MGPFFTKPPAVIGRCRLSNSGFCGPAVAIPPADEGALLCGSDVAGAAFPAGRGCCERDGTATSVKIKAKIAYPNRSSKTLAERRRRVGSGPRWGRFKLKTFSPDLNRSETRNCIFHRRESVILRPIVVRRAVINEHVPLGDTSPLHPDRPKTGDKLRI